MPKCKGLQKITVEFQANTEERADDFIAYLNNEYAVIEFELYERNGNYVATAYEEACGWYEPEVRYTKNGDGSPEFLEIDFECIEDDLGDVCKAYRDRFDDEEIFALISWSCELER